MKITIDLPDHYAEVLSKWASVSRTLRGVLSAIVEENFSNIRVDDLDIFTKELEELILPLDALHQLVRAEIWKAGRHA